MTRRSADLPYKTREVAMLTSRRMLSLLLAASAVIAILSGCYAAPVNEATEQGGETSGAIVTDSKIPVTTYPVPEERISCPNGECHFGHHVCMHADAGWILAVDNGRETDHCI